MKKLISMACATAFALALGSAAPAMAGDTYEPLEDPNGRLVGLCSAENLGGTTWEVRARHVRLSPNSAFSAWGISGPGAQHLDGTITGGSKFFFFRRHSGGESYEFRGVINSGDSASIKVDIRDHGKPDPNNLTDQVATPGGGCDGTCPTIGVCELVLID